MWLIAPEEIKLTSNIVDIWLINCQDYFDYLEGLITILSSEEKERANRFKFKIHQQRFIINRANLRIILSKYLAIAPEKIEFEYSEKGKPNISKLQNLLNLNFNLSHSEDYVIYGISQNILGIDLEKINPKVSCQELAQRFFCPSEFQIIASLPEPDNYRAFYLAWTSKEAYLKAIGEGLSGGLDSLELDLLITENRAKILKINNQIVIKNWQLYNFNLEENFIFSVIILSDQDLIFHYYKF